MAEVMTMGFAKEKTWTNNKKRTDKKKNGGALFQRKKKGAELSFQDKFTAIAIKYFGGMTSKLEKSMPTLGDDLLKSDYFIAPQAFLSVILFLTALTGIASVVGILMF